MNDRTLGLSMIEDAVHYALTTVDGISGADLRRPTPCSQWDLGELLNHLNDSMDAVQEGLDSRRICLLAPGDGRPPLEDDARSLVEGLRRRADRLLRSCAEPEVDAPIAIGDLTLPSGVAVVGAIEIAVHGWDVAWARGTHQPIPPILALDLLVASPLVITTSGRDPFFTAPLAVPRNADPSDHLIAFLGRRPFVSGPAH